MTSQRDRRATKAQNANRDKKFGANVSEIKIGDVWKYSVLSIL